MLVATGDNYQLVVEVNRQRKPQNTYQVVFRREFLKEGKVVDTSSFDLFLSADEIEKLKQAL